MKYMMFVCSDLAPDETKPAESDIVAWLTDVEGSGKRITGDRLQPVKQAKTVRVRKGKTLVTDGPFAETREALLGYYLIDAKNLDDALGIAARVPSAQIGSIEVRPIMVYN